MAQKMIVFIIATGILAYYIYTPIPEEVDQKLKITMLNSLIRTWDHVGQLLEWLGWRHVMHSLRILTDMQNIPALSDENITVTDTIFSGVPVRLYVPTQQTNELKRGIIYIHGGGWCLGSPAMKSYDTVSRNTAKDLNAVIVSTSYRLAPEFHFPTQFDDVYTVVKYFLQDHILAEYSVDPERTGISGDSAGGNLAAAVTQQIAEDAEVRNKPKIQALIYPALQPIDFDTPSYQQNKNMPLLTKSLTVRFWSEYFANDPSLYHAMASNTHMALEFNYLFTFVNWSMYLPENVKQSYTYSEPMFGKAELLQKYPGLMDSRAAPLLVKDSKLKLLPKTYVMTCEYDVLRDDGIMYVMRLRNAGVSVTHYHVKDGLHGALSLNSWPFDLENTKIVEAHYINWLDKNL
ncbi:arylacetamide deacetylase-like [Protopterus annectens]|uniref:arylacetamide deacetylase-like n=1 Tax=Protopterus annectens TaxID=7888 RepID=UPI001CF99DCA|nr:arylacetamide deacetylase-like [Protopterus annectens]XP_043926476.1 arylacetamide deacetylase-like [Protopterus annectens]XP_043926477.1 arylacetamide deacetylase-like [Protopterus annectens]